MCWKVSAAHLSASRYIASGGRNLKGWLDRHGQQVTFLPQADADITFNINMPEDLALAEDRIRKSTMPDLRLGC